MGNKIDKVVEALAKELEVIFYTPATGMLPMNWKGIAKILLETIKKEG